MNKTKALKRLSTLLLCLTLLLGCAASAESLTVQIGKKDLSINEELPKGVRSILLLLYDAPDGEDYGPSETIMLASIDSDNGDARMTVLPAAGLAPIPEAGELPLSQAYALGGLNLAIKTINELFDLNVRDCIAINMSAFGEIISSVGDLELTLSAEDAAALGLSEGPSQLNAEQSLSYMRLPRSENGPDRQYQVFRQALYQGTRDRNYGRLFQLLTQVMGSMNHNIAILDLAGLGTKVLAGASKEEKYIPQRDSWTPVDQGEDTVYRIDWQAAKAEMHAYLYE